MATVAHVAPSGQTIADATVIDEIAIDDTEIAEYRALIEDLGTFPVREKDSCWFPRQGDCILQMPSLIFFFVSPPLLKSLT
jgi:hypothetical protein